MDNGYKWEFRSFVKHEGRNLYSVPSETQAGKAYVVAVVDDDGLMTCSCPDWAFRGGGNNPDYACKHIIGVNGSSMYRGYEPEPATEPAPPAEQNSIVISSGSGVTGFRLADCAGECGAKILLYEEYSRGAVRSWCQGCAANGITVKFLV